MSIRFFTMPTGRAGTRRIPGVNELDRNARPGRLVGNIHSELEESPGMPFIAVFAANRCSLSDACEIFQSECLARYDSFMYQGFCDTMVRVFLKAFFASREFLEAAFSRAGTYPLQPFRGRFFVSRTAYLPPLRLQEANWAMRTPASVPSATGLQSPAPHKW